MPEVLQEMESINQFNNYYPFMSISLITLTRPPPAQLRPHFPKHLDSIVRVPPEMHMVKSRFHVNNRLDMVDGC